MKMIDDLLVKVKLNLIIEHSDDDELLRNLIRVALDYAKNYQNKKRLSKLPPSTEQALIMLVSHWYESRDGGSGGFMSSAKGAEIMNAVNWLLSMGKVWSL
jgi:uncharacterized phage protein (predicted DNA packaging)